MELKGSEAMKSIVIKSLAGDVILRVKQTKTGVVAYSEWGLVLTACQKELDETKERLRQIEDNGCYTADETGHICGIAKQLAEAKTRIKTLESTCAGVDGIILDLRNLVDTKSRELAEKDKEIERLKGNDSSRIYEINLPDGGKEKE